MPGYIFEIRQRRHPNSQAINTKLPQGPLSLIWMNNHMHSKMWAEMTYPVLNLNGCTIDVRGCISIFIPNCTMNLYTYSFSSCSAILHLSPLSLLRSTSVWLHEDLLVIFMRTSRTNLEHDGVIKWKHVPRCWSFVSGIHRSRSFDVFFDLRLSKRLSKQSIRRWFETPIRHQAIIWTNADPIDWRIFAALGERRDWHKVW